MEEHETNYYFKIKKKKIACLLNQVIQVYSTNTREFT